MILNKVASILYGTARILRDINAVRRGPKAVAKRMGRKYVLKRVGRWLR